MASRCVVVGLLSASVLLLVIAALTLAFRQEYTPIYTSMECVNANKSMGEPEFTDDGNMIIRGTSTTICKNPNHFALQGRPAGVGKMLLVLGSNVSDIGSVTMESYTVAPFTSITMHSNISILMTGDQMTAMLLYTAGNPVMVSEIESDSKVELSVYGIKVSSRWMASTSWCGFAIDPTTSASGPAVCALSLGEVLPKVVAPDAPTKPFLLSPPADELEKAAHLRDAGCFTVIGVALFLALCLCLMVYAMYRRAARDAASAVDDMEKDGQSYDAETGLRPPSLQLEEPQPQEPQPPLPVLLARAENGLTPVAAADDWAAANKDDSGRMP